MPVQPTQSDKRLKEIQAALAKLREELSQVESQVGSTMNGGALGGGSSGGFGAGGHSAAGGLIQSGGGDFVAPTLGLTVNPDGSVRYEFEGKIFAEGLNLRESNEPEGQEDARSVTWRDALDNNAVRMYIWASLNNIFGTLIDNFTLQINARNESGGPQIDLQTEDIEVGGQRLDAIRLRAGLGGAEGAEVTLLRTDATGNPESDFVRITSTADSIIARGAGSVTFNNDWFSTTATIEHGLGSIPTAAVASGQDRAVNYEVDPDEFTSTTFKVRARQVETSDLNATRKFSWIAMT